MQSYVVLMRKVSLSRSVTVELLLQSTEYLPVSMILVPSVRKPRLVAHEPSVLQSAQVHAANGRWLDRYDRSQESVLADLGKRRRTACVRKPSHSYLPPPLVCANPWLTQAFILIKAVQRNLLFDPFHEALCAKSLHTNTSTLAKGMTAYTVSHSLERDWNARTGSVAVEIS